MLLAYPCLSCSIPTSRPCSTEACTALLLLTFGKLVPYMCLLHITVAIHSHSTGPESWVHLLPVFGINAPYRAERMLHRP